MSSPQQVTLADLSPRLLGLGDFRAKAAAEGYTDEVIQTRTIPAAIRAFERDTKFRCTPIRVVCSDDGTYSSGVTFTVVRKEPQPYNWHDAQFFMRFRAQEFPIRNVLRLRLTLNRNTSMLTLPQDWIQFDPMTGYVWIQPVSGAAFGQAAAGYAILQQHFGFGTNYPLPPQRPDITPAMIALDFDAGLPDGWGSDDQWADIHRAITCRAARMVLADLSQVFDAGLANKTVTAFGISQSSTQTRFADRIAALEAEEDEIVGPLRGESGPIFVGSL